MRPSQRFRKAIFPIRRRVNGILRRPIWEGGPPGGVYSEAELLRAGMTTGGFASPIGMPAVPVDSEIRTAGLGQERHSDWDALWACRENVFLAAPTLAHTDLDGRVCSESLYGPHAWDDPVWLRNGVSNVRELSGDFTSIVSRWNDGSNYFHWFLDGLTRLVHLPEFPPDCRILVPSNLPAFAKRSIELLGLTNRVVEAGNEDLRIERYWFAGPTMLSGCPDPLGVNWLRQAFLRDPQPPQTRLLYVDRNAPTRNLTNRQEVRNLFEKRGWEIIDPGQLTFDEQMTTFRGAQAIVGTHGAAMTNILWAAGGTRVLEFMPSRRRNGCYAGIALAAALAHETLICPSDKRGAMEVPISMLARWMELIENG